MEHESFEDAGVAAMLNQHFVSIKVDREERPDVDRVYMTFVQVTTGQGGWPMSVWLTPSLEPFYGGTYYPPASQWGRPGFMDVLDEIARVWREERQKVVQSAGAIVERLRSLGGSTGTGPVPGTGVLDVAVREFAASFDARRGGFGTAPKFPRPSELLFLLREHARTPRHAPGESGPDAREMVLDTLRAMAIGGMRDHLGGGFHRYSVDGEWRVPHFEKMLYDQAQLVLAYVEAAQLTGEGFWADVAADTLDYVRRDLAHPDGGFYSAEDADSIPPELATPNSQDANAQPPTTSHQPPTKSEGAFYIWSDKEIGDALGADADVFRLRFGILPDGNAPFDPQNEFTGRNLLYSARTFDDIAAATGQSATQVASALERARVTLLALRGRRPRPHLDDKVLTAWNGLMIAAFARAGRLLGRDDYVADAQRAATFIRASLWRAADATLLRRFRQGQAGVEGYAEDYAYLIFGLLELFQADGDPAWLEWALTLQRRQDELFWDDSEGGWFSTTGADPSVLLRLKEEYDGAEPAASSVSVLNLLVIAHLSLGVAELEVGNYQRKIHKTFGMFANNASMRGRAVPMMLAALSTYHSGLPQIVVAGDPGDAGTSALMAELRRRYMPTAIVVPLLDRHRAAVSRLLPWTAALDRKSGRATAYVCRDFACDIPATTPEELIRVLSR
jgi:uncharacterized protein YyaL (SSP411 family)